MKKKAASILLSLVMLFALPMTAYAAIPDSASTSMITFSDGSYLITTVVSEKSNQLVSSQKLSTQTTYQTVGTKTISYYSANNTLAWDFSVTGTFRYNGTTATAISSSVSDNIYNSDWWCASKSSSYSGATATASGIFKSISLLTKNVTTALTCSPNGTLS